MRVLRRPKNPVRFEIWQAAGRIHSIDNPVKLKVLRLLEDHPRRLAELVVYTRKAKSTLSALHLRPLVDAGLVEESPDAHDARTKHYRLAGHRLGSSDVEPRRLREAVLSYVQSTGALPLPALLEILDPRELVRSQAHPDYVEAVARRIGASVGASLTSAQLGPAIEELGELLEEAGLASLSRAPEGRPRILAHDAALQSFATSLAEAALSAAVRISVVVDSPTAPVVRR